MLILHGSDRFRQDEQLQRVAAALIAEHGEGGVDTLRFDGQSGPRIIADVLDECRSCGLMQQHKIVVVENADLMIKEKEEDEAPAPPPSAKGKRRGPSPKSPRELLEAYAAEPSPTATLVLRATTWRPGNLDKAVAKIGAVVKCEPMSDADAAAWAQARAKETHKTTIDAKAAGALVAAVGTELGRIDTELEKLALAAGGNGEPITPALVDQMTGVSREEEFWAIQDTLLSGDAGATLAELRQLVEVSRHDPVALGWSAMEAARRAHLASIAARQNIPVRSLAKPLKIFGWGEEFNRRLGTLEAIGRSVLPARAARLMSIATASDAANKSGLGDPMRNLEVLAVRFGQALGTAGRPKR